MSLLSRLPNAASEVDNDEVVIYTEANYDESWS
jgi:hypothetical protein